MDNHRITDVEVVSHDAERRTSDGRTEWVLTVTLRLLPQDTATPYDVGVFFVYLDSDDERVYRTYEQLPANSGGTPRTVTLSSTFDSDAAGVDTFDRYRIDIVHG